MSFNDSQLQALEQLREVEAVGAGLLTIDEIIEAEEPDGLLLIKVTISCEDLERVTDGLPLQDREEFVLLIPPGFPFNYPSVLVSHTRFSGFPHVQWQHSLCLYQAPSTEWNPSDGMYGFLDRLHYWLKQGALGQLDPIGAPLHPPVTYRANGPNRTVIPRVNTPEVGTDTWFGLAHLRVASEHRVDLIGWSQSQDKETPSCVAAVLLLPKPLPYEFPTNVGDLIRALAELGISQERLILALQRASMQNEEKAPLYVIVGTPMRGVRGGVLRQHLTAWYIAPLFAWALREAIDKYSDDSAKQAYGTKIEKIILDWAKDAKVEWCTVREDRPEIVVRRDHSTPLAWFAGRSIAIWGCGALGGHVAEYLTRAGVRKLMLFDNATVTPGVLTRQPYDDSDVGFGKAYALQDRLKRIRPDVEIEVSVKNILNDPLSSPDWVMSVELVIEATASTAVLGLLERRRWMSESNPVPVISMAIGHTAEQGMVVLAMPGHSGGPLDVCRRLKLEASYKTELRGYLDEFWPEKRRAFFQPEPGCSDATFVGSAADVAGLAALMINRAATDLLAPKGASATGHFVIQPHAGNMCVPSSFRYKPDLISRDVHAGYQVRITLPCWTEIGSWIERSAKEVGPGAETGGLLFGERDDSAGVIWVSEVSGPPSDSVRSAKEFVCGVVGTTEMNAEKRGRTRGAVHYLGMWHTHPDSMPLPSATDWGAMRRLVQVAGGAGRTLMLIVGTPYGTPMLGTYVFRAADFAAELGKVSIRPCVISAVPWSVLTKLDKTKEGTFWSGLKRCWQRISSR